MPEDIPLPHTTEGNLTFTATKARILVTVYKTYFQVLCWCQTITLNKRLKASMVNKSIKKDSFIPSIARMMKWQQAHISSLSLVKGLGQWQVGDLQGLAEGNLIFPTLTMYSFLFPESPHSQACSHRGSRWDQHPQICPVPSGEGEGQPC